MKNRYLLSSMFVCAVLMSFCQMPLEGATTNLIAPQTLSGVSLYRDTASIAYSTNTHYTQGATMLMTNMTCYSTADLGTNSTVQGLGVVSVAVATSVSSSTTGTWQNASVAVASNGTWWINLGSLPSSSVIYWQCKITDVNTNVYYYQQQMLIADPHL